MLRTPHHLNLRKHFYFLAVCFLSLLAASRTCRAEDLTNRFGMSANLGGVSPISPSYITDNTDSVGFNAGGTVSFDMGPHFGIALSYDHFSLGNGMNVSTTNMLFRARFFPDRQWTPTLELGPGSAKGVNSSRIENFSFKSLLGIDYFVTPEWAVGPQLGYVYISHSGDASTYVHLLTFGLRGTYYFGRT